jgi:hypothetical protein
MIDDEWLRWIAENISLGGSPESIREAMIGAGISLPDIDIALRDAFASPYVRGGELLRARLAKRDWMLETLSKLRRMHPDARTVERRHRLSRDAFLRDYYSLNRAVIITGMLEDWPALQKWSLDYFSSAFGDREVEVQVGRDENPDYEVEQHRLARPMLFGQFVDTIRSIGRSNDLYMTARNSGRNRSAIGELWDDIIQIPEYLDGGDKGAGFFWLGPAGTLTPFHHDLTNNFMAQVIGRKRILIIPAAELPRTYNHLHCYTPVDGRSIDFDRFPALRGALIQEVILHPGEILFLPVGHWHFVEALDISCTMSFTNFVFDNDFSSFYSTYHGV